MKEGDPFLGQIFTGRHDWLSICGALVVIVVAIVLGSIVGSIFKIIVFDQFYAVQSETLSTIFFLAINPLSAFFGVAISAKYIMKRPLISFVVGYRKISIFCFVGGISLLLIAKLLLYFIEGGRVVPSMNFNSGGAWPSYAELACILVLISFQAASEEILIRGVLAQIIYSKLNNIVIGSILVSLLFSILHGWSGMPLFVMRVSISILLSALCLASGGLEFPAGFHLANNIAAYFGVGLLFEEKADDPYVILSVSVACGLFAGTIFLLNGKLKCLRARPVIDATTQEIRGRYIERRKS